MSHQLGRPPFGFVDSTVTKPNGAPFGAQVFPFAPAAPGPNLEVDPMIANLPRVGAWRADAAWQAQGMLELGDQIAIAAAAELPSGVYRIDRVDESDYAFPAFTLVRQ